MTKHGIRVDPLGVAMRNQKWVNDRRPVYYGPAPWSKTGTYGINASLMRGGAQIATVNVGEDHEVANYKGSIIPFTDMHSMKNGGWRGTGWRITVETQSNPEYYTNLVNDYRHNMKYKAWPTIYSLLPLKVDYEIITESAYNKQVVRRGVPMNERRAERNATTGVIRIPAGKITRLGGEISIEIESDKIGSIDDDYSITRRIEYVIRVID